MAILVSKSGGCMSVTSPHSKRETSRSSSAWISFGGLSLETTICLWASKRVLKVWKNSSYVDSLPAMKCISSIRRTSTFLYFSLNDGVVLVCIALISWFVKSSLDM